jgi:23S rRNA (cytosine1962-C5)-methyltransferase
MSPPTAYELIDFGHGRKLERFGGVLLDRPCPAADGFYPEDPAKWKQAGAKYLRKQGNEGTWQWNENAKFDVPWTLELESLTFELRLTESGHLGVFPEQAPSWRWIGKQVRRARRPLKVLNLFAYTGGSTLSAAAAGADVVHVDAAKNVVGWARRNAKLSARHETSIRWIVEDARKFVHRELKRGNSYDAVILDPPSYGHGPKGEVFKLSDDLMPLLSDCKALTEGQRAFVLMTCHSPGYGPAELEACLADAVLGTCGAGAQANTLDLRTADGRQLNAGVSVRWPGPLC